MMKYRTERHRRKVMREMRMAGYNLPGSPYRSINRSYGTQKNKSSKVKTTVINKADSYKSDPYYNYDKVSPTIKWEKAGKQEQAIYCISKPKWKPLKDYVFICGTPGKKGYLVWVVRDEMEIFRLNRLTKEEALKLSKPFIKQINEDYENGKIT